MKSKLFFAFIVFSALSVQFVSADVPTVTDVMVEAVSDGEIVTVTIRHSGPTNNHYVSRVEVQIGEDVNVFELDPQSTVTFTEEFTVPEDGVVEVRAFCNLHGWSSWVSTEADEPVLIDNELSGIPGFSLAAVGLGLALILVKKRSQ